MILLTGASGFIGKHLLKNLIATFGHENVVAFTSHPIPDVQYVLHNNYNFDQDIFIKEGFDKIEVIIHAGSFTPKNGREANDIHLSNLNILNTEKLISANLPNLKKVIFFSTIDIYDNAAIINECSEEKPKTMYGFSKMYNEKLLQNWCEQQGKTLQILRVGHVYGPGEEGFQKLIPETFRKVLKKEEITIFGTGNELRSYIFVEDLTKAIVKSLSFQENLGVINLVGSQAISSLDLINKIRELTKSDLKIKFSEAHFEGKNYVFDNSKMMKFLMDRETTLEEGLLLEFEHMQKASK